MSHPKILSVLFSGSQQHQVSDSSSSSTSMLLGRPLLENHLEALLAPARRSPHAASAGGCRLSELDCRRLSCGSEGRVSGSKYSIVASIYQLKKTQISPPIGEVQNGIHEQRIPFSVDTVKRPQPVVVIFRRHEQKLLALGIIQLLKAARSTLQIRDYANIPTLVLGIHVPFNVPQTSRIRELPMRRAGLHKLPLYW